MTSHFSLNIKTLSADINAMVLSIALVKFTETEIKDSIHMSLSLNEQTGRHVNTTRLHWWFEEYRLGHFTQQFPQEYFDPRSAIKRLNAFILESGSIPPNPNIPVNFVWMRGIQFDWAILEHLSHSFATGLAFRHNALKDQRTFCDDHVEHTPMKTRDALKDATYHAIQVMRVLKLTGEKLK